MTKKKILLVHNYYQIGGGEHTVFENEKNMLLENGHEVYTYTRSNDELKSSRWKLLMMPFTTTWSSKTYFEVRRLIREKGIDIVHCHNTFPLISPSVYYAAQSRKVPVVQTIHNFRFLCPNGLFYCNGEICEKCREQRSFLPALKNGCYRSSRIQTFVAVAMVKVHRWLGTYRKINYIFLTEFNKSKFSDLIDIEAENVFVKPNFVSRIGAETVKQPVKPKFLFAGRLDRNKGIDFLLDVWPELPREYELHIYGDGEYRSECEKMAQRCENIHYFGFQPQSEIFADLSDSAALLFTSDLYEGFPMSIAECYAAGRPVISTNLGNHSDIITASGGGVTFVQRDSADFKRALEQVLAENALYSESAARYYQETLTRHKNYEKLSGIYDKARIIR